MSIKMFRKFFVIFLLIVVCGCSKKFSEKGYTLNLNKSLIYKNATGAKVKLQLPEYVNGEVDVFEDGDNIFVVSASRGIVKISTKDGKVCWKQKIAFIPQKNLSFDREYIYFTSIDNKFYILNYESGKTEFIYYTYSTERNLMNNVKPMIYKNVIVVVFGNGETIIFDKETKKVLKKLPQKEIIDDSVMIKNGILRMNDENILDLNNLLNSK